MDSPAQDELERTHSSLAFLLPFGPRMDWAMPTSPGEGISLYLLYGTKRQSLWETCSQACKLRNNLVFLVLFFQLSGHPLARQVDT